MKQFLKNNILFWTPRILGIGVILFLGIFALDVFVPGKPWWYITVGLLVHLIPNYILLVALIIAWKHELYGGIFFLIIGLCMTFFFQTYRYLLNFLIVSFPIFVIGILFLGYYFLIKGRKKYE